MSKHTNRKTTINISKLTADTAFNNRLKTRYDLPSLMADIREAGRIITPIVVSKREDGTHLVMQGNRRTLAGQALYTDPQCPVELKEALAKTDVIIYEGLTANEEIEMMMDHGRTLSLCRTETAMGVIRLVKMGKSEKQIGQIMLYSLAKFTRNEVMLNKLPKEPGPARDKAVLDWFRGTLSQYLMHIAGLGDYVHDQFILTMKAEDGILEPERKVGDTTVPAEVVECRMTRTRVMALVKAKSVDAKSEAGWSREMGGESFNKLLEDYRLEDKGEKEKDKKTRPSAKELEARADAYSSMAIRNAFLVAAGHEDAGQQLPALDDRLKRMSAVFSVLHNASVKRADGDPLKALINAILSDDKPVGDVELALAKFA